MRLVTSSSTRRMIGRIEETSASFEARSAPRSHPTAGDIGLPYGRAAPNGEICRSCDRFRGQCHQATSAMLRTPASTTSAVNALFSIHAIAGMPRAMSSSVRHERPSSIVAPMATAASSRSAAQAARAGRSADRRSDRRGPEPNFSMMESAGGVLVAAPAGRAVDLVRASQWIKRRNAPPKALLFQCRLLAMTPWLAGAARPQQQHQQQRSPRAPELHRRPDGDGGQQPQRRPGGPSGSLR